MYTLKKYIGLDNIITEGKSFLVPTYTFSISSSLASCLESFHLLIFMKSHPYLGTCKDTLGTNGADSHKDLYPRREALVKPCSQLLSLPPAVSVAGPGYSSKTCTCAFLPQTSILYQRQNIHWIIRACCHCQSPQQSLTDGPRGERVHLLRLQMGLAQAMDRSVLAAAAILHVAMALKKLLTKILQINCSSTSVCCHRPMCSINPRCQPPYESADL